MVQVTKLTRPLTTAQAAEALGIAAQTLAVWRMSGKGPRWFNVGKRVRYRTEDVEAWIAENMSVSPTTK